jgi:hypothetical protein
MFKWVTLAVATIAVAVFGWMVNDLRLQAKRATATVNENLPEILEKSRTSAQTLAVLSEDIRQLRDLAGASNGPARDRTLVAYADAILDAVESSGGSIGTKGLLSGDKLKDPQPAIEWATAARKEAVWLTFRAASRDELLQRLTQTKFGSEWIIQLPDAQPVPLRQWIERNVALPATTVPARP